MPEMKWWGYYLKRYSNQAWQVDEDSFAAYFTGGNNNGKNGTAVIHGRNQTSAIGPTWYFPHTLYNLDKIFNNVTYALTEEDPRVNYMVIDCQNYPEKWRSDSGGLRANFWRYNGQNAGAFQGYYAGYIAPMLQNVASVPFTKYGIEGKTRINYRPGYRSGTDSENRGYFDSDEVLVRPNPEEYIMIGACHPRWGTGGNAPRYVRHPGDDSPNTNNEEIYPVGSSTTEYVGNAVFYYAARARAQTREDLKPDRKQPPRTLTLRTFWREPMENVVANLVEGEPSTVTVTYDPDTWGIQFDEQGNSYWRNPDLTFTNYTLGARPAEAGPDWMPISKLRITSYLEPETCDIKGNIGTHKYHYIEFSPMEQVEWRGVGAQFSQPNGYDDQHLKFYETRGYTNQTGSYDTRGLPYNKNGTNYHMSGGVFLCTGTSITVPMEGRFRRTSDDPDIPVWTYSFASWDNFTGTFISGYTSSNAWAAFDTNFYFSSNKNPYPRPAGVSTDVMKDADVLNYHTWYPAERGSLLNYCPYRNGAAPYTYNNNYRAPFANPVIIDNKAYTWTLNYQKQYILVTVDMGEELSMEVEVRDELPKKLTDEMPLFKILTEGKTPEGLYYPEPQMFLYESAGKRHIERKNSAYYWVQAFSGNGQTGGDRTTRVPQAIAPNESGTIVVTETYYHGWQLPIEPVTFVRASRVDGKTIRTDTYGAGTSYYGNGYWAQPPITRGSEYFRDIEFGGWDYHYSRGSHRVFIFDYKDVGYGEPIPLKLNQRDDGLGIHGGPGRLGYFGQSGGWSSRLKSGGSW